MQNKFCQLYLLSESLYTLFLSEGTTKSAIAIGIQQLRNAKT